MPQRERVMKFVAAVSAGNYIEAIEGFYDEHATLRENPSEPRVGRDAILLHERGVLSRLKQMRTSCVHSVLLDGNYVAINWVLR